MHGTGNNLNGIDARRDGRSRRFTTGEIVDELTSEHFDVPTTMTRFGDRFYVVNARFGTAGPEPASYSMVAIPRS